MLFVCSVVSVGSGYPENPRYRPIPTDSTIIYVVYIYVSYVCSFMWCIVPYRVTALPLFGWWVGAVPKCVF